MYDSEVEARKQALEFLNGEWDREVVPRLPENITEMAKIYGAFERGRLIRSSTDLLRGFLSYVSGNESLQATGAWAVLIGLADVSASNWCHRLSKARAWLEWLMAHLIGSPAAGTQGEADGSHGYRIWLLDATHVGQEGGKGNDWRLHTCYDWIAGKLVWLQVTDQQGAEGFWHLPETQRTILVGDRAYGYRDELLEQSEKDRPAVVRISSSTFPCQTSDGTPFDIAGWLREQKGNRTSCWVFITGGKRGGTDKRIAVRLVAQRLSGAARQRERDHAKRQASKHGHPLSKATEEECEWILIATTLTERWSDEEVLLLYRARWLIERLFKLMKSLAHLVRLPTRTQESSEAYLCAWFIFWLLQEDVQQQLREEFASLAADSLWQEDEEPLSRWTMTKLSLNLLLLSIRGTWTRQRWQECLPRLKRFCCPSSRHRTHWETFLRQRLTQGFASVPVDVST